MKFKKGQEIVLTVDTMAFEGKAISRIDGIVAFVPDAVPGDTIKAIVTRVKQTFIEAKLVELVKPSPLRIEPRCRYVGSCGGCKMQHVSYDAQLKFKRQFVVDSLERIGKLHNIEVPEVIGSPDIFYYRNKMEFSVSDQRWLTLEEIESGEAFDKNFAIGLHIRGKFDKVIDIKECFLQSELSNRILEVLRTYAREHHITPYSVKSHEGFLRFVVVRISAATGEVMVNIVTADHRPDIMQPMVKQLRNEIPEITTIVNNINRRKAQIAVGEKEVVYYGEGFIIDHIGPYRFRISASSFFQTNTNQAESLYRIAKEFGDLTKNDVVLDLYSGTGTISIFLSDAVKKVYGIETVETAVSDARANASFNKIENVHFIEGEVLNRLRSLQTWLAGIPDVVYLDPPRSGLHPDVVHHAADLNVERIVYVSCNPTTQARDLAIFVGRGYHVDKVQPVDMFPHAYHIENVARLTLG